MPQLCPDPWQMKAERDQARAAAAAAQAEALAQAAAAAAAVQATQVAQAEAAAAQEARAAEAVHEQAQAAQMPSPQTQRRVEGSVEVVARVGDLLAERRISRAEEQSRTAEVQPVVVVEVVVFGSTT